MKFQFLSFLLFFLFGAKNLWAQQSKTVYTSETLKIEQISPHTFVHISYLSTQDFGKVACNGMIVIDGGEALVFDTPTDDAVSRELIDWLETDQKTKVVGVLATHFHNDCLGGLNEFHAHGVPSYGSTQTQALAKAATDPVPQNGFVEQLILEAGKVAVVTRFLGEGHTRDNVVAYVPADQVLFGGCLIKEVGATVGYLGDANTGAWSGTVRQVKSTFSEVKTVIPGHGKIGNAELLDYTIRLFEGK
ncbi:subclass B1 metallo-beta-lactamase [Algoriphagus sp. AK58]|uniref:subclass B1 metallo-beta-lactamase n=1 Tax=Algoriphagus sp. AK58 TaxID=1406877 RepID=UPI0016502932|nr:subclass B1 metallo-beta-lactamase [Algoriphagus sp. AK58]MBC6368328.1 subclass B1 metallo-beta-lactamase [Algoriphagus sp. AK58]